MIDASSDVEAAQFVGIGVASNQYIMQRQPGGRRRSEHELSEEDEGMPRRTRKRLFATVSLLPGWPWLRPIFYCLEHDGRIDFATTCTLLELIKRCGIGHPCLQAVIDWYRDSEQHSPTDPSQPIWSIGDINIWLFPPVAKPGHIAISNESIAECSTKNGAPQQFTVRQFQTALIHWRLFTERLEAEGKERLLGTYHERLLPR